MALWTPTSTTRWLGSSDGAPLLDWRASRPAQESLGMETKRRKTGHEVETKPPQPHYGYKAARRPRATYQDCFSAGRDIYIKHLLEVCRQDYKLLAQLLLIIKLWHCCDPDNLSPKVGHHLHLASIAVPRYRPQQAVATCCPNLVRRPRPLWCKISVLPHVAHGSATKSW